MYNEQVDYAWSGVKLKNMCITRMVPTSAGGYRVLLPEHAIKLCLSKTFVA